MANHEFRPGAANGASAGTGITMTGAIFVPDNIVVNGVVEGDATAPSIRIGSPVNDNERRDIASGDLHASGPEAAEIDAAK